VLSTPPANAYVYVDLGATKSITGVRYVFNQTGAADAVAIQLSTDKSSWTMVASVGNAPALAWQTRALTGSARYVRFYLTNPNSDPVLGYLAEVEVWATTSTVQATPTATTTAVAVATATRTPTATATRTPTATATATTATGGGLTGGPMPLVASGGSAGATFTGRVWDKNLTTDWHTTVTTPPTSGYVYVDLGTTKSITGVRYVFDQTGASDAVAIQLSTNKSTWTTVANVGNAPALAWQQVTLSGTARFVRFFFTNPNADPALGYLAEVEVWGPIGAAEASEPTAPPVGPEPTSTATTAPTATATPTPASPIEGAPLPLVESGGSSGATHTRLVRDLDPETDWHTLAARTPPDSAFVYVDLGSVQEVTGVRWLFDETGYADAWELQVSTDKVTWTTVYREGNAPADVWRERPLSGAARYVRFLFSNPERDPELGYLAEVEVWGPLAAAEVPTVTPVPLPTETPAPLPTDTPIPVPTETPAPVATPYPVASASASDNGAVSAAVVLDGDPSTYWFAAGAEPPAAADLTLDLGASVPIGTIRWLWAVDGTNDAVSIQTSDDGVSWVTIADASAGAAGAWPEVYPGVSARFVRFTLANPNGDPQIGGLAEVQVWP
jgi:hypothetical protein